MQNNQKIGAIYDINKDNKEIRSHQYVIGDVHGCYYEFKELVKGILLKDPKAQFILVGDIIDRGPQTLEMLSWAMKNVNRTGSRFKMIRGNHEHLKINYLEEYLGGLKEGLYKSLNDLHEDDYNFKSVLLQNNISNERIEYILKFFKSLPFFYETDVMLKQHNGTEKKRHFIIVHSDIDRMYFNQDETFKKRVVTEKGARDIRRTGRTHPYDYILWNRNYFGHAGLKHTIIVHGHTPTISHDLTIRGAKSGYIDFKCNDINVDCGLVFKDNYYRKANLAAIRLDDLEEFYLYQYPAELSDNIFNPNSIYNVTDSYYKKLMLGEIQPASTRLTKKQREELDKLFEEAGKKLD